MHGSTGRVRMLSCVSSTLIPLIARHREVVCVVEFVAPSAGRTHELPAAQDLKSVGVETKAGGTRRRVPAAAARRSAATAAVVDSSTEPPSRARKPAAKKNASRPKAGSDGKVVDVSARKKAAKPAAKPAGKTPPTPAEKKASAKSAPAKGAPASKVPAKGLTKQEPPKASTKKRTAQEPAAKEPGKAAGTSTQEAEIAEVAVAAGPLADVAGDFTDADLVSLEDVEPNPADLATVAAPEEAAAKEEAEGFIYSDADDADEPEQQVSVAGATADPVKDYLKQIGKVPSSTRSRRSSSPSASRPVCSRRNGWPGRRRAAAQTAQ